MNYGLYYLRLAEAVATRRVSGRRGVKPLIQPPSDPVATRPSGSIRKWMEGPGRSFASAGDTCESPMDDLIQFVDQSRAALESAGHHFMTDSEVANWAEELRSETDCVEEAYRQMQE